MQAITCGKAFLDQLRIVMPSLECHCGIPTTIMFRVSLISLHLVVGKFLMPSSMQELLACAVEV